MRSSQSQNKRRKIHSEVWPAGVRVLFVRLAHSLSIVRMNSHDSRQYFMCKVVELVTMSMQARTRRLLSMIYRVSLMLTKCCCGEIVNRSCDHKRVFSFISHGQIGQELFEMFKIDHDSTRGSNMDMGWEEFSCEFGIRLSSSIADATAKSACLQCNVAVTVTNFQMLIKSSIFLKRK